MLDILWLLTSKLDKLSPPSSTSNLTIPSSASAWRPLTMISKLACSKQFTAANSNTTLQVKAAIWLITPQQEVLLFKRSFHYKVWTQAKQRLSTSWPSKLVCINWSSAMSILGWEGKAWCTDIVFWGQLMKKSSGWMQDRLRVLKRSYLFCRWQFLRRLKLLPTQKKYQPQT